MNELSMNEINEVSGGDAAATRQPGQNSWGQWTDPEKEIAARCKNGEWVYCLYDLVK